MAGPCITCGKVGCFGAPRPGGRTTLWACAVHRASLPPVDSHDYAATEDEDAARAMIEMAVVLKRDGHGEAAKAIGQDAMHVAFRAGLDAYFALREARLRPPS